ncbi:MAG: 50S ribosomal protein L4 [Lentisphaeria bacterium]
METTIPILKSDGSQGSTLDLQPGWVELEKGEQAVHESVVAFRAAERRCTASTKTRGEVRGGGTKPYRQKGTGRARMGSTTSPLLRGGGIIFGPKPRSYKKKVNRKVRKLALKRTFSERLNAGDVLVVENLDLEVPKTKEMLKFLGSVGAGEDALVIVDEIVNDVLLASRNLPDVQVMKAASVNPYWMLLFDKIVFTRAGFENFVNRFCPQEEA